VAEAEIDALLAQPDFQELVESLVELEAMPESERLALLERLAWCTLERAMADDDWRAAAFVLAELHRGRNPARSLARRVVGRHRRATAGPPAAAEPALPSAASVSSPPRDPVTRAIGRCAAGLCDEVILEQAARHAAATATAEPADAALAAAPPIARASRPRRQDETTARPRHGAAGMTIPLPEPRAKDHGVLRARAQGP
jgi:hypothetical protein